MGPERWARIEALFHRALELRDAERAALLDAECAGDPELRAEVERLIVADSAPHELVSSFEGGALLPTADPLIGRQIGAYRLTSRIAAGGMGVVYRAERSDGLFQRDVAIKLIRIELATEALVRKFEQERRTLAALQHPHIAALSDGGTTPDGRPYLVMELVRGIPIDRYCEEHRLSIADRLRLFALVCRAVHFAHQNLVVHRDLKPGNILIDENGAPKLLDFGIARLLDESRASDPTALTMTAGQALTPDYAAPEQITHGPVTTAMDVYSLGVLLYELLTGRRPFPSENKSPVEWHRAVLERPPTRPSSTALWPSSRAASAVADPAPDALADTRRGTVRSVRRRLRGDLDRIVLMALRKEPERRYASADEFADDVERHLGGHPVRARPDSLSYCASKFVQRNRVAVVSAAALVTALVAGFVTARKAEKLAVAAELRAREQAAHARVEADSFREISAFLMDAFLASEPVEDEAQRESQRRRVVDFAERVRREHAGEDHLRANLLDSLGGVAQRIGYFGDAEALAQEAATIRARSFGEDSLEYALSLRTLGFLRFAQGELAAAAEHLGRALAIHRANPPGTHTNVASAANDLAACLRGLGRLDEAEALHREALATRRAFDPGSLETAQSLNNSAAIDLDRGELHRAAQRLDESLAIRRRILGTEDPLTLQSMSNLASTLWRLDQRERAHALLAEVEAACRGRRADGEEDLAQVLSNRAAMLIGEDRHVEAEPVLAESLALHERLLGDAHPAVATVLARRAQIQEALGRAGEARATWDRVLAIRRAPGGSPRYLGEALSEYGTFLSDAGAKDDARAAWTESIEVLRASGDAKGSWLALTELALGESLLGAGDASAARAHLDAAIAILEPSGAGAAANLERARSSRRRCDETAGASGG